MNYLLIRLIIFRIHVIDNNKYINYFGYFKSRLSDINILYMILDWINKLTIILIFINHEFIINNKIRWWF